MGMEEGGRRGEEGRVAGEPHAHPPPVAHRRAEGDLHEAKKLLRGIGAPVDAMCPTRPNVIWAMDVAFDQTRKGRMLKVLERVDHQLGPVTWLNDTEHVRPANCPGSHSSMDRLSRLRCTAPKDKLEPLESGDPQLLRETSDAVPHCLGHRIRA